MSSTTDRCLLPGGSRQGEQGEVLQGAFLSGRSLVCPDSAQLRGDKARSGFVGTFVRAASSADSTSSEHSRSARQAALACATDKEVPLRFVASPQSPADDRHALPASSSTMTGEAESAGPSAPAPSVRSRKRRAEEGGAATTSAIAMPRAVREQPGRHEATAEDLKALLRAWAFDRELKVSSWVEKQGFNWGSFKQYVYRDAPNLGAIEKRLRSEETLKPVSDDVFMQLLDAAKHQPNTNLGAYALSFGCKPRPAVDFLRGSKLSLSGEYRLSKILSAAFVQKKAVPGYREPSREELLRFARAVAADEQLNCRDWAETQGIGWEVLLPLFIPADNRPWLGRIETYLYPDGFRPQQNISAEVLEDAEAYMASAGPHPNIHVYALLNNVSVEQLMQGLIRRAPRALAMPIPANDLHALNVQITASTSRRPCSAQDPLAPGHASPGAAVLQAGAPVVEEEEKALDLRTQEVIKRSAAGDRSGAVARPFHQGASK